MPERRPLSTLSGQLAEASPLADTITGDRTGRRFTQAGHGFSVGSAVYWTGAVWALALSDAATTLGDGIVALVDGDDFIVAQSGYVEGLAGLTPGAIYYVSDTVAGDLSLTEGVVSNPILLALTATTGLVLPWRPDAREALPTFDAYSVASQSFSTAWEPLDLDTQRTLTASIFSHTTPDPEVTILVTGTYLVTLRMAAESSGGSTEEYRKRIEVDTGGGFVATPGLGYASSRSNECSGSMMVQVLALSAGDVVRGAAQADGSTDTCPGSVELVIVKLDGARGPQGVPGSGSTITVADEGTPIPSTPHDTLDFVGAGVVATDAGGGTATITIPGVPVGSMLMWAGPSGSPPTSYLVCDGAAVSRAVYAALFALLGTTFGAGDGVTTFNLPDLRNRYPLGADAVARGGLAGANTSDLTHTHADGTLATDAAPGHTHADGTLATDAVPGHTHTVTVPTVQRTTLIPTAATGAAGAVVSSSDGGHSHDVTGATASAGGHSHDVTGATASGGLASHDNRPASVGLHFIIRALP